MGAAILCLDVSVCGMNKVCIGRKNVCYAIGQPCSGLHGERVSLYGCALRR